MKGIIACVQQNAWTDDRTMKIWDKKVLKVHLKYFDGCAGLLLDDFECHKSNDFIDRLRCDNCLLHFIPSHYTSLLQPCDVGINKPLKDRLKESASDWRRERQNALLPGQKMPSPKRKEILE